MHNSFLRPVAEGINFISIDSYESLMPVGIQPADAADYAESDYQISHDRFIRYMCIQRREKNQIAFTLHELMLQAEIWGSSPDTKNTTDLTSNGNEVYRIMTERALDTLTQEKFVEPTRDTNIYRMTEKLMELCDRGHKGTYGLPSESPLS